jgi:hypothetical protein
MQTATGCLWTWLDMVEDVLQISDFLITDCSSLVSIRTQIKIVTLFARGAAATNRVPNS